MSKVRDLSEASLTELVKELTGEQGCVINLRPTKLILVKYPDETNKEWMERCDRTRLIWEKLADE